MPTTIPTPLGDLRAEQFGELASDAVLWVFGAGGGFGGPARGVYSRLGEQLAGENIGSMCVDYRRPGQLDPCVSDLEAAIDFVTRSRGVQRVLLVGHSFGGAVVIRAGLSRSAVAGVAALSPQSFGTLGVEKLSPRPLLLIHGEADEVLPFACSQDIYRRAREPKEIILYPGCKHGLDQCIDALDRDLISWIRRHLP